MDDAKPLERDLAPIAEALYRGRKIDAIKLFREQRGGGLKEAKDAVEQLEAALRQQSPERFKAASGAGCLGCVLAMLTLIAAWSLT